MHRIAIVGFRHAHIFDLYQRVLAHPQLELVATCEENLAASLLPGKGITPSHTSFANLLKSTDCEIICLGDTYGRRGPQAIAALQAGKHILADKPLCTSLAELEQIASLATGKKLHIGLMLDLRDHGNYRALRDIVRAGRLGVVQTITVTGQHPLLLGARPGWYFEPGQHGGTLNDIAIHALDLIPWVTGLGLAQITLARSWNAKASRTPHFKDCAQFALTLSNGGGVLGDVSYLAPERCGYQTPNYWRITIHGTRGVAETSCTAVSVTVADDQTEKPELLPPAAPRPGGYLEDFLACVAGAVPPGGLGTASVLAATRSALQLEAHAHRL